MHRRRACIAVVAALFIVLIARAGAGAIPAARADTISATVGASPAGPAMASGFVGVSFEYRAIHQYTGRDPRAIDPVLVNLLAGLADGRSPVIRVGGDSTDATWWPIRGTIAPPGVTYPLTPGWLRTTRALADDLHAKLILGINLSAGSPAIAAAEGRALVAGIGRTRISALEIGNEPDLYGVFPWYRTRTGRIVRARGRGYRLSAYARQFAEWGRVLPAGLALAGPAVSGPAWLSGLTGFAATAPRLRLITYHRYPLRACTTDPSDPSFPSIPHLLSDTASDGLAAPLARDARIAHAHHRSFRVAEMNSASCEGARGVSDTFASALWALDAMFAFARAGVDGVNVHMLPGSAYELFSPTQTSTGAWQAFVHPEYYGLALFGQAFPPGARLLPVSGGATGSAVKVWATRGPDGTIRLTLINKDPSAEHDVAVSLPPGAANPGTEELLQAPSVSATDGVTLGGQTFGDETMTGTLPGNPQTTPAVPSGSTYSVPVPAASAALVTIPPASTGATGPGGSSPGGGGVGLH